MTRSRLCPPVSTSLCCRDSGTAAPARLTATSGPFLTPRGQPIAENLTRLFGVKHPGPVLFLNRKIDQDETGATQAGEVWTGTFPDGSSLGDWCNDWTDATSGFGGLYGDTNSTGPGWVSAGGTTCNSNARHLYCVQR